jgi:DNA repair protein RadC
MIDDVVVDVLSPEETHDSWRREGGAALRARAAFTDVELVAVLIGGGCHDDDLLKAAEQLVEECGGLCGLPRASREVVSWPGLGSAQALALRAACELGTRLALNRLRRRLPLVWPRDAEPVARYLALRYERLDQEVVGAVFIDIRGQLIGDAELYRGTLCSARVEPRQVLKQCLLRGAAAVVVFHTHPSGDTTPSAADLEFTSQLWGSCHELGIELIDHLIIGGGGAFVSIGVLGRGGVGCPPMRERTMKPIYTPEYMCMLLRLREARAAAGLTQEEVAKHFEQGQAFVSKCESGERRIDPIELGKFGKLYKRPIEFFLNGG